MSSTRPQMRATHSDANMRIQSRCTQSPDASSSCRHRAPALQSSLSQRHTRTRTHITAGIRRTCRISILAVALSTLLLLLLVTSDVCANKAKYSLDLTGIDSGTAYTLNVKIGSATTGAINTFRLIADTGSSNDAILGANCCGADADVTFACSASPTCSAASTQVKISFAGASIGGHLVTDQWASKEFDTITKQFLVIEDQESFYRPEYDGITGLAYSALAQPQSSRPQSFYDDLVTAGATADAFGMQLCGIMQPLMLTTSVAPTNISLHAGQLLIGGIDGPKGETYYSGPMLYSPIAREAWYVTVITDIGFNGKSLGIACSKYNDPQAIIDSGTSNMAFPPEIYNALMAQIEAATLAALPAFDRNYFDARKSCCGAAYCDPRVADAVLLTLPSIYITLALQNDNSDATNEHFTVEIPPSYYWRPEMNGVNNDIPCRAIGIAEGNAIMLGDVFMDGLYAYHDRANKTLGLAVTTNCPNGVTSTKKVYVATTKTDDWCNCFSSNLQSKTLLARHLPWGAGCFFWVWWMYVVLASVGVVLLAAGVGIYWFTTDRKMKKMKAHARLHQGSDAPTRANSASSNTTAALIPARAPSSYRAKQPPPALLESHAEQQLYSINDDASHYVQMGSPHSHSGASSTSSIALLSSPSASQQSLHSQQQQRGSTSGFRKRGVSRESYMGESV